MKAQKLYNILEKISVVAFSYRSFSLLKIKLLKMIRFV